MFRVFRPSFEVVKEGRILHFVSGDRKFYSILTINVPYYFTQMSPVLFWVVLGHFVGLVEQMGGNI
jgi:hypothetical protein